jgi:hypothetical protein
MDLKAQHKLVDDLPAKLGRELQSGRSFRSRVLGACWPLAVIRAAAQGVRRF